MVIFSEIISVNTELILLHRWFL